MLVQALQCLPPLAPALTPGECEPWEARREVSQPPQCSVQSSMGLLRFPLVKNKLPSETLLELVQHNWDLQGRFWVPLPPILPILTLATEMRYFPWFSLQWSKIQAALISSFSKLKDGDSGPGQGKSRRDSIGSNSRAAPMERDRGPLCTLERTSVLG